MAEQPQRKPIEPSYITWEGSSPNKEDIQRYGDCMSAYGGRARANHRDFIDIESHRSVRTSYTRDDWNYFRWDETVPVKQKRVIKTCMEAYKKVGIVHNIIDLMGDFGSQGINIVHEDKSVEKFYREWARRVGFKERSERFLNHLYRTGNVFIYTSDAKVTPEVVKYIKTRAKKGDIVVKPPVANKTTIPWRYNFLNPLCINIKKGDYKMFVGRDKFTQKLPAKYVDSFKTGDPEQALLISTLPLSMQKQINEGAREIELDPDKLSVFHYKKDDWDDWANPMIESILDDIMMLEKMRLADLSALDGAISNIRLWILGDFEHKILPTKEGVQKLRNILASNVGGGDLDLVWGPELSFQESNSQVYKFLGSEKYNSVLNSIYAGLGVPPTLTGMSGNGGGFTNNFISLKTLVERLQYGRERLTAFWNNELEKVRKAMGFRKPAFITFDQMNLSDDTAEKQLLIELLDRNVISEETVRERFKEITKVENVRINREEKMRENDKMPPKAGPFHPPNTLDDELTKMDKQFEDESEEHDKDLNVKELDTKNRPKPTGPGGKTGDPAKKPAKKNGRPPNKKDTGPRKKRSETPRSKPGVANVASTIYYAFEAYDKISKSVGSAYMAYHNVKDMRKLTKSQILELEGLKLDVLTNLDISTYVRPEHIHASLLSGKKTPEDIIERLETEEFNLDQMTAADYRKGIVAIVLEMQYID